MFSQLQQDAAHIDMGIRSLNTKMAAVMTNYTYNNPDADAVLARRHEQASHLGDEMREFVSGAEQFARLQLECQEETARIAEALEQLADGCKLRECLVTLDKGAEQKSAADEGDENKENTAEEVESFNGEEEDCNDTNDNCSTDTASPNVVISRCRSSMPRGALLETPMVQSTKSSRLPTLKPMDRNQSLRRLQFN